MSVSGADITTRPLDLNVLLDGIGEGTVVLPDFQRDFEWSEGEVASLVATVMVNWPAGSLLLMKGSPEFFKTRPFEGVAKEHATVEYVVLDGQQRLTALYNALRDSGDHVYAVDLELAGSGPASAQTLEEAIVIADRDDWDALLRDRVPPAELLVPLAALSSASDYFEWRDEVVARVASEDRDETQARLSRAYKDFLGTINHYQFPSVILENDLPTEAVARIFERINRGGMRLSTFDLLVARAYTPDWNLRNEWDRAQRETELLEVYLKDEGTPVAQVIALREEADIRRPAMLSLSAEVVQAEWEHSVNAMERALEFVVQSGMRNPEWLPYQTLLIPLAALARDHDLVEHTGFLETWLWGRSLQMEYDVASSTKVVADYDRLCTALTSGEPFEVEVESSRLWRATRRQQAALWRTVLSLALRRGALDVFSGDRLVEIPTRAAEATVVPLFARSSRRDPSAPHLWILSQLLLKRGPRPRGVSLLAAIQDVDIPEDELAARLETQFVRWEALHAAAGDAEALMAMRLDDVVTYLRTEFPALRVA